MNPPMMPEFEEVKPMYSEMSRNELAENFAAAIKKLAADQNALDNFESYLSYHFDEWMERYAFSPAGLVSEMVSFANMYD